MNENRIEAIITETSDSLYSVSIEVNGHTLIGDEPESAGGKNLGPAPYDLLLSSLGECTALTVRWFAQQRKWSLEKVSVKVTHEKKDRSDYFTKRIEIVGNDLSEDQKKKLHDVAAKCPVHRTLTSDVIIDTLD